MGQPMYFRGNPSILLSSPLLLHFGDAKSNGSGLKHPITRANLHPTTDCPNRAKLEQEAVSKPHFIASWRGPFWSPTSLTVPVLFFGVRNTFS